MRYITNFDSFIKESKMKIEKNNKKIIYNKKIM